LTKCLRHIVHVRPGVFVILDELAAAKPVTFEWGLHALEQMRVDEGKRSVLVQRGKARLDARVLLPESLTFGQTDKFDPPPEDGKPNQWHLTASTRAKATEARFLTVLRPYRAGKGDALPELRRLEGAGVGWTEGGVERSVVFGKAGVIVDGAPVAGAP
ncbi:hypothetical protein HQ560_13855, partial [bacterium]|nr:hypothetical protein [bacterium]